MTYEEYKAQHEEVEQAVASNLMTVTQGLAKAALLGIQWGYQRGINDAEEETTTDSERTRDADHYLEQWKEDKLRDKDEY